MFIIKKKMNDKIESKVILIGGTPRVVNQVKTSKKYGKIQEGMSVEDIIAVSRADRLLKKELEKNASSIISDLVSGRANSVFIDLPNVDWKKQNYHKVKGAYEISQKLELDYATQAANMHPKNV